LKREKKLFILDGEIQRGMEIVKLKRILAVKRGSWSIISFLEF